MKDLSDEIILNLWRQSDGHLYKFAKLLREYLCQ